MTVLPEGLQFLKLGWWIIHVLSILFVYVWAYNKGRGDERRAQRARDTEAGRVR